MLVTPHQTHIPMRQARARLSELSKRKDPTVILCQNSPVAILFPMPRAYYLSAGQRRTLRPQMRTQFKLLLLQLLPEGR
jgi:hypothetical protein